MEERISFLLVWIVLLSAGFLCFWGYKYFQSLCLIVLGALCGMGGIKAAGKMTDNMLFAMVFFVIFTFIGVCLFYFFSILLTGVLRSLGILDALSKREYLIAAVCGGSVAGAVIYRGIYRNGWVAAGTAVLLAAGGAWYGHKRAAERKPFRTYEDLYRLKPLPEVKQDA